MLSIPQLQTPSSYPSAPDEKLPAWSTPRREKVHAAFRRWRKGERPSTAGIMSGGTMVERIRAGVVYLPSAPALDAMQFKCSASKAIAQAVALATIVFKGNEGGEAMDATFEQFASIAGRSKRTAQNATDELERLGIIIRAPNFRTGDIGRDGKLHRVLQTANRWLPGPTLQYAFAGRRSLEKQAASIRVAKVATPPEEKKKREALRSRAEPDSSTAAMKKGSPQASSTHPEVAARPVGSLREAYEAAMRLVEARKAEQAG